MKPNWKSAGRFSPAFLFTKCEIHPAVKISAFVLMASYMKQFQLNHLLALGLVLAAGLISMRVRRFFTMLRRMRWLFISMLVIYSYTTPGQYLAQWPIDFAPTYEGISQGLLQVGRVCLVIAGISMLMATSTQEALMAGIYTIIRPLKYLGLSPERFAARLLLTIRHVENKQDQPTIEDDQSTWQRMLNFELGADQMDDATEIIHLNVPKLGIPDYLCLALFTMIIGLSL